MLVSRVEAVLSLPVTSCCAVWQGWAEVIQDPQAWPLEAGLGWQLAWALVPTPRLHWKPQPVHESQNS